MNASDTTSRPAIGRADRRSHHHDTFDRHHHPLRHWSPTLIAARLALLALSLGGAIWSIRWAWHQVSGR
jgi:hypothetical protein